YSQTFGSLGGASGTALVKLTVNGNGTSTLTTGGALSSSFAGLIAGGGNLLKVGSSNFTLGGNNTWTGTTSVNGGTLTVNGAINYNGTAGGGTVNLNSAGVVLQGSGTITGQVCVAASTSGSPTSVQRVTVTVPAGGTGITVKSGATFAQVGTTTGVTV